MKLAQLDLSKILFLDIETVPQTYNFQDLDEKTQQLYSDKTRFFQTEEKGPEDLYERAGIYAEFGKIICISVGVVRDKINHKEIRIKSFYGDDEKKLLEEFCALLNKHYNTPRHLLCGHNGKEFDFPFIARRLLINGVELPDLLDIAGKKPWEIQHLDTLELWKFGDYKNFTSLSLLTHIFGIPTPKDDISGADVARVYYEEKDLERIRIYCQKDVVALIQLFLKFRGEGLVNEDHIHDQIDD